MSAVPDPAFEIWRDPAGIPHIRAESDAAAWQGLGCVHARDRLFQMDLTRRRAYGRAAEWMGVEALPGDRFARRAGGEALAKQNYAALGKEARAMLDAYSRGANAETARLLRAGQLPREYALLDQPDGPGLWQPWDSIAVMRQIGLAMGSVWLKLFRAAALPSVGPEGLSLLRHDDGGQDRFVLPPGAQGRRWVAALADLAPSIEALMTLVKPDATGGGSNNWVVSGAHTDTGQPILIGDPHRELEMPAMYAQAHVAGASFDAIGLTVPGVPGFPHVGHNARVAWCVTHAMADIQDLFIERFEEAGRRYLHKGTWHDTEIQEDTIHVRGQDAPEQVTIHRTCHGPVICGDPASGGAITLASPQLAEDEHSFDCLPRMLRAGSVAELHETTRGWALIDHNLVAADRDGQIGHRVRASLPRRPSLNGWLPVPGWCGTYDWDGCVPFEDMPAVIDPPVGRIITANNRVVPDIGGYYFCTDAAPPYRAKRIAARLDALESLSIETMSPIMMDQSSAAAHLFRDHLSRHQPQSGETAALCQQLLDWDGVMEKAAITPTLYARLRLAMSKRLAEVAGLARPEGPAADVIGPGDMLTQTWWVLPGLLRSGDTTLLGGTDWAGLTEAALQDILTEGEAPPWGEVHRPVIAHPLARVFPESAGTLDLATAAIGGDNDTVCATGIVPAQGLAARYAAIARYAFDLSDWSACRWIACHGTAADPAHPHGQDQHGIWAEGQMIPMLYDWPLIEQQASLERQPEGSGKLAS